MRNAALVPLALALLAACADQPTLSDPPPSEELQAPAPGVGTMALTVSTPQTVGWNQGSWYAGNQPFPEAGGGRVVWEDASGPLVVRAYDFASGARSEYAWLNAEQAYASTAGRYTAWSDENAAIHLRNELTGSVRAIGTGFTPRVSAEGRVAYVSFRRDDTGIRDRNVSVYDASTGATRVLTSYSDAGGAEAREPVVDGDWVVWGVNAVWPGQTYALRMMNLATGEERELWRHDRIIATRPWVSAGRVVWTEQHPGDPKRAIVVYDIAAGTKRQITTSAADPGWGPRISGSLVVWEDNRNYSATNRLPEMDIFAYDLSTGKELAIATGPNHQGWPTVDGGRVVWTELVNDRWEIRAATVQTVSLHAVWQAVDRALAAGEITSRGAVQTLQAFLSQAAHAHQAGDVAGERAALERFRLHLQHMAGTQVSAAAATRLTGMADALLAAFGS